MALWGFWNERARDLDRLLSVMPDFDAARFDAGQLQQAIAASTPSGGSFSSAHETLRLYFAKMEPRMFATVFETFCHNALTSQKGSFSPRLPCADGPTFPLTPSTDHNRGTSQRWRLHARLELFGRRVSSHAGQYTSRS